MIELKDLYIKNSVPLEKARDLAPEGEYFNEEGHCLKYLGNDEYIFIKQSPLISGESLPSLSESALKLFWVLSKNM